MLVISHRREVRLAMKQYFHQSGTALPFRLTQTVGNYQITDSIHTGQLPDDMHPASGCRKTPWNRSERTGHFLSGFKEQRVFSHPFGNTHPVNGVWAEAGATVPRFVMLARAILKPTPKVRRIPTLNIPLCCRNVQRTVAYIF
jgi:hypothetical protein